MNYLRLAKQVLQRHQTTPQADPEPWDTDTARRLVDEVLAEQEKLNVRWPWPETRQRWEALWVLGDAIDDAFLAEDLSALRRAIARWREEARRHG